MIRRRTYIALIILTMLALSVARAGDAGRETPFSLGAGARSLGMGGAFTTLSCDATAIYYNPAGLSALEYQEAAFMHTVLFESSIYDFASWVYPITENHGVGAGFMRIGTGDIVRRVDFADRGTFDYSYTQMLLSYGRNVGRFLSTGISLKIVNQSLDNVSDYGVGLDLGWRIDICHGLALGAIARNLMQPELALDSLSEKTPRSVTGGLSLSQLHLSEHTSFSAGVDLEKHEDRAFKVHAGAELSFLDRYNLRAGYDRDNLTLGVGLRHGRLKVDYAYKLVDYVDNIHHFSLSFFLGKSVSEQIRLRELAKLPPEPSEEEKQFRALMETANSYLRRFELDSAAVYFERALEYDWENEEIIGSLAAIAEARRVQREQEARLRQAEAERNQTINSFLEQAELLYTRGSYHASLDLLDLIFDIDQANPRAQLLQRRNHQAIVSEVGENLDRARKAAAAGQLAEAIEAYTRVLELDPDNEEAGRAKREVLTKMGLPEKLRLGIELFEKGRFDEAAGQFRSILKVNPDETVARDYLDRISQAQTRTSTLEDLERDQEVWGWYLDGLRYMRNKEYQKAIEVWEKVLRRFPNNPNTLSNIEQARLRLGTEAPVDNK